MALTSSYLITTKNLGSFFDSLITAKAPETFTYKFVENLGFKSTNDRLFISVLKGLDFLDGDGVPTEKYFSFLDQSQSKRVLAAAIELAYADLFEINKKANELSAAEIKNKLKTLTQGKHSDKVVGLMANTFVALATYADWDKLRSGVKTSEVKKVKKDGEETPDKPIKEIPDEESSDGEPPSKTRKPELHYNVQIILPESRDQAVYNALFEALSKHLF